MAAGNPCQPEPTTEWQQMAAGNPCQPEPIIPKNKSLYLECQWKPHKSITVDLKLSKPENI